MIELEQIKEIAQPTPSKMVLLVIDGLGGLPHPKTGKTELESARTPNLDRLASKGICGLIDPVSRGITPGSSAGHLALFGYDPVKFAIGRGILEVLGIDFPLRRGDVAARGNFCTVNGNGIVTDRRAGRISTESCTELCQLLNAIAVDGAELFVLPVKEHRFVVILRGSGFSAALSDSDPQQTGVTPKAIKPLTLDAKRTAGVINQFITQAKAIMADHHPANMILLRGFSQLPTIPTMTELYQLNPAAIASYPMYRGLARLVGMRILNTGSSLEDEFDTLEHNYGEYDFFFLHVKETDSAAEDGDFGRKVRVIEEIDTLLPRLIALEPDVVVVTGDHSTPAVLEGHSWHSVPLLLHSRWCRPDDVSQFSERACITGGLGRFPAREIMLLMMAHARKLTKFSA